MEINPYQSPAEECSEPALGFMVNAGVLNAALARAQARLVATRRSVAFRLGRATTVALADRTRLTRAPTASTSPAI